MYNANIINNMLIGIFIVMHQFLPKGIKAAPTNGPPIADIPNTLPRIAYAFRLSSNGNSSPINAPPTGKIPPQPKPCMILPMNINSILAENAIKLDPIPNNITSNIKIFFLP